MKLLGTRSGVKLVSAGIPAKITLNGQRTDYPSWFGTSGKAAVRGEYGLMNNFHEIPYTNYLESVNVSNIHYTAITFPTEITNLDLKSGASTSNLSILVTNYAKNVRSMTYAEARAAWNTVLNSDLFSSCKFVVCASPNPNADSYYCIGKTRRRWKRFCCSRKHRLEACDRIN